jgi:glycosyltransferase involved in cell wall biosynthesis
LLTDKNNENKTKKLPTISVILPVFNSAEYLSEAIESILKQTHSDFELIIIYDVSHDSSLNIIKEFSAADARIKIVYGKNAGLASALNLGLDASAGEFVARMDSDDISHPERLAAQLVHMRLNSLDICGCHWNVLDEKGCLSGQVKASLTRESIILDLCITVPFCHGSVMVRKTVLVGGEAYYSESYITEDYDLWVRLFNSGAKFGNVDSFLFSLRQSPGSLSVSNKAKVRLNSSQIGSDFVKTNSNLIKKAIFFQLNNLDQLSEVRLERLSLASIFHLQNKQLLLCLRVLVHINILIAGKALLKALYVGFLRMKARFLWE